MSDVPPPPSSEAPLQGGCLCGAVRYEVSTAVAIVRYCHCTHCQRRTGTASSINCLVSREGFRLLSGLDRLSSYKPPSGVPKLFCATCGSALFSGDPFADEQVAIRMGTFDADPGARPQYRQFVASAAAWEPIPNDGLPRFPGSHQDGGAYLP